MTASSRVLVTGAAGLVGRALMARLQDEPDLHEVGLDLSAAPGVRFRVDVTGAALERAVDEVSPSVIAHLVARVSPPRDRVERAQMRRLHEEGTRRVARAARRVGAHLVLVSSAVVYGARADNPARLRESAPVRPNPDFPYAVDKAAQERIAREVLDGEALSVVRPAIVYGPGARSYLTELLRLAPVIPAVDGARPPLQFLHVEDLADALAALCRARPGGVFNVASAGTVDADDLGRMLGKRVLPVPGRLIAPLLDLGARVVPERFRAPSYILDYLRYPFVLDVGKLRETLGWRPRSTSEAAVAAALGIAR